MSLAIALDTFKEHNFTHNNTTYRKSLKIPKCIQGQTDNAMVKEKERKNQTMIYKTLHPTKKTCINNRIGQQVIPTYIKSSPCKIYT